MIILLFEVLLIILVIIFYTGIITENLNTNINNTQTIEGSEKLVVADSFYLKYKGLSADNTYKNGMLFTWDTCSKRTMTARNQSFPIDVIYLDENFSVTTIEKLSKMDSLWSYYFDYDKVSGYGKYVIEVEEGWCSKHNIQLGDSISLDD